MKLRYLEFQALGPYAHKEHINFEEISQHGLFLISGPTGSGKTFIFDAVCYALFEQSSTKERPSSSLRCQHAHPEDKSYVELRFEHQGKLWCIRRDLAYSEAKKRGTGFIQRPAVSSLQNITDGIDYYNKKDIDACIHNILNVNYEQFKHIVMIAQGDFKRLLLASSKEREEIFRDIFQTQFLTNFSDQLQERFEEAKGKLGAQQSVLHEICNQFITCNIAEYLSDVCEDDKQLQKAYEEFQAFLREQRYERCVHDAQVLYEHVAHNAQCEIDQLHTDIQHVNTCSQSVHALCTVVERVRRVQANIEHNAEIYARQQELYQQTHQAFQQAEKNFMAVSGQHQFCSAIAHRIKTLEAYSKTYNRYKELGDLLVGLSDEKNKLSEKVTHLQTRARELHERLHDEDVVTMQYIQAQNRKNLIESYYHAAHVLSSAELSEEYNTYMNQLALTQTLFTQLEEDKQHAHEVMQAYMKSQAASLALTLNDDAPCPVCGSLAHPHPAQPHDAVVTREELERAQQAKDDTQSTYHQQCTLLEASKARLLELLKNICRDIQELYTKLIEFNQTSSEKIVHYKCFTSAQDSDDAINLNISKLEACIQELKHDILLSHDTTCKHFQHIQSAYDDINSCKEHYRLCETQLKDIHAQLEHITQSYNDYNQQYLICQHDLEQFDKTHEAATLEDLQQQLQLIRAHIQVATKEYEQQKKNLSDVHGVVSQCKGRLAALQQEYDEQSAQIHGILHNLEQHRTFKPACNVVEELLNYLDHHKATEYDSFCSIQRACKDIDMLEDELKTKLNKRGFDQDRIGALYARLSKQYEDYQQILAEYMRSERLYQCAQGNTGGSIKLSFERFVMGIYFTQILELANLRLLSMSGQRYSLTLRKNSNKNTKVGLDLDVYDTYTGLHRGVETLSGGECFMASLALSLALSDYISQQSGGHHINALFIDEGFGTLDAQSLQHALGIIRRLQDDTHADAVSHEKKIIGIISHIELLKAQIQYHVEVYKNMRGSHIVTSDQ